jgi:hypothetical protein
VAITDVIARLRAIDEQLPPSDGVAAFNHVYLQVTEAVRDRLGSGFFADPAFVEELDVCFAGLFIGAVDAAVASDSLPLPWEPLFDLRRRAGLKPIQFVLAGMNAHINHDLAVALVRTCVSRRRTPEQVLADYERLNDVLATLVRPVRQSLLDPELVAAGRPLSPLADLVSNWSIDKARDAAWVHGRTLYELRDAASLTRAYAETLGRMVALVSRQLLVALPA